MIKNINLTDYQIKYQTDNIHSASLQIANESKLKDQGIQNKYRMIIS